jgi:iron complex transport system substrate-binding protein
VQQVFSAGTLKRALCVAAILLFRAALSHAQTPATPGVAPATPPAYREVIDETGRAVRIPQPVRRIVSLAPSLTETIYALGLQDLLVGDTDYCDFPPAAQKKPKVGGAVNPSLEAIADLRPDLVLVTRSLNRLETVHSLENIGIPSYGTDPHTVDQIISSTKRLADVLGAPEAGSALAKDLERHLAETQKRVSSLAPRRVLFVVWREPLISVGKDTFIADALQHAGGTSIVDSSQSWPQMNLEEVVRQQPDYLVFAESHSETAPSDVNVLSSLPGWRILDAVKNRRYAVVSDAVNRPSPRIVSAIEDLAKQLHPEAFVETQENSDEKEEKPKPAPQNLSWSAISSFRFATEDPAAVEEYACAR